MYRVVAILTDGTQEQTEGSLEECVQWCEFMLQTKSGDITLQIDRTHGME